MPVCGCEASAEGAAVELSAAAFGGSDDDAIDELAGWVSVAVTDPEVEVLLGRLLGPSLSFSGERERFSESSGMNLCVRGLRGL